MIIAIFTVAIITSAFSFYSCTCAYVHRVSTNINFTSVVYSYRTVYISRTASTREHEFSCLKGDKIISLALP